MFAFGFTATVGCVGIRLYLSALFKSVLYVIRFYRIIYHVLSADSFGECVPCLIFGHRHGRGDEVNLACQSRRVFCHKVWLDLTMAFISLTNARRMMTRITLPSFIPLLPNQNNSVVNDSVGYTLLWANSFCVTCTTAFIFPSLVSFILRIPPSSITGMCWLAYFEHQAFSSSRSSHPAHQHTCLSSYMPRPCRTPLICASPWFLFLFPHHWLYACHLSALSFWQRHLCQRTY